MTNDANATLDRVTINELTAMLDDGVYELFDEYIRNTKQLLKQLDTAVEEGDKEAFHRLVHSLKGSSGNLGVANVYRLSEALEQETRGGDSLVVSRMRVRELEHAFLIAHQALEQLMPGKP